MDLMAALPSADILVLAISMLDKPSMLGHRLVAVTHLVALKLCVPDQGPLEVMPMSVVADGWPFPSSKKLKSAPRAKMRLKLLRGGWVK